MTIPAVRSICAQRWTKARFISFHSTRRQISFYRMFCADFSVNFSTDFHEILYGLFASHSGTTVKYRPIAKKLDHLA